MSRLVVVVAIAILLLILWLLYGRQSGHTALTPAEGAAVEHWLECEECRANELPTVVAIGVRAVPTLGTSLILGPGGVRTARLREHLIRSYQSLAAYRAAHGLQPLVPTQAEYIGRFLGNYRASYRIRSAMAVALIGGTRARNLLTQASTLPGLRPDVRARIVFQKDSVWHP